MTTPRFLLVLHGHIPDVVGHGTWPHGANWLYEAAAEVYLPFLRTLQRLRAAHVPVKATVGMTPVLCEQLQDDRFQRGFRWYLRQRSRAAKEDRERLALEGELWAADVAEWWRAFYAGLRDDFEALPGLDILEAFRHHAEDGMLEPISSAATHGFLPLLPDDRAIARQLDVGLQAHERHFGKRSRGVWLPECAYRPAGEWISPANGRREIRSGLEDFLSERGVEFFFVETHLVAGGVTYPAYGGRVVREDGAGSPYQIYGIVPGNGGPDVAVLARDPLSSQQVWSGIVGYPGDPRYLEFHKKRYPSGHRYWRVTDSRLDLGDKLPYEPGAVPAALSAHAAHFASLLANVASLPDGRDPVVVGMFDFELFGHWWFEGPEFLEALFRELAENPRVSIHTTSEALALVPPTSAISMPPGTWGRNGDFQVWWNDLTIPYWRAVESVEQRMEAFEERARAGDIPAELFEALERQTLLLQSSDWPFLIDNEVSRDYAEERIRRHTADFASLAEMAEKGAIDPEAFDEIAKRDRLFTAELRGRLSI